jgi:hypothetical protein
MHEDHRLGGLGMSEDRLQVVQDAEGGAEEKTADERVVRLSTALTPLVSAMVDVLGRHAPGTPESSLGSQRQALRTEAVGEARARYRLSRVGSGTVASVASALWLLPQLVAAFGGDALLAAFQTSLLAPLFVLPLFDPITFGIALYAWLFFSLTWLMEQNDLRRIDGVTTDSARGVLLRRAVLAARQRGEQESITKADMRDALGRGLRPTLALRLLGARDVTASFLDRVTSCHVEELMAQGVLAPSTHASLSPRYLVAEGVSRELMP